jgi:cobalamin biosynthetic protein CobC
MHAVTHGGDLGDVQRRFPDAPEPWIDLSTGINPEPYPLPPLPDDAWTRLPSARQHDALIFAAAARYGVKDQSTIVAAPGTQALIQLLPRLLPRSRVAVVGPTYEEHEVSWRRQGHRVTIVPELAAAADADVVVVVNPDNPSGRLVDVSTLRTVKGFLVVDEAFIDFLPSAASLAPNLPARTIVLRSFGKTYGLAGVRLGFAIAERSLAERLRGELGPWAVSGPALEIGTRALQDDAWLKRSAARLEADGQRLDALLVSAGFDLLGSTPLFRLARHGNASVIVKALARKGIHVRTFRHMRDWIRFGMPSDFERLEIALGQFKS